MEISICTAQFTVQIAQRHARAHGYVSLYRLIDSSIAESASYSLLIGSSSSPSFPWHLIAAKISFEGRLGLLYCRSDHEADLAEGRVCGTLVAPKVASLRALVCLHGVCNVCRQGSDQPGQKEHSPERKTVCEGVQIRRKGLYQRQSLARSISPPVQQ